MAVDDHDEARFERVDWAQIDADARRVDVRSAALAVVLGLLVLAFAYDWLTGALVVAGWHPAPLDWLYALSAVFLAFFVVLPLVERPARTAYYWRRLRTNRWAVVSLAYVVGFGVLALVGPALLGGGRTDLTIAFQPPAFTSAPSSVPISCVGRVADGRCYGTLQYPFGTDAFGRGLGLLVVDGMRVSFLVGLVTASLIVPIATAVGTVAGYLGGTVDDVLMRYVDVQQSVPAFVVYLIAAHVLGPSLFLVVLVFGLLSWGGVARLVRSEVLQRRSAAYVLASRSAGAGRAYRIRRHLLPNVSSTVVTATSQQIPLLILAEAALSFMKLTDVGPHSFGAIIAAGLQYFYKAWWLSTVPVVFLALLVVAISVLGDAMRDVLDPRDG